MIETIEWEIRKIIFKTKQKIREFFCIHRWAGRLILSGGRNTHHEVVRCDKCRKSKTVFSGTREEWYKHIGEEVHW